MTSYFDMAGCASAPRCVRRLAARRSAIRAVANEPIASPVCPEPQRGLRVAFQWVGIDRALHDSHVDVRVKQLVDPLAAVVKLDRSVCGAHRSLLVVIART